MVGQEGDGWLGDISLRGKIHALSPSCRLTMIISMSKALKSLAIKILTYIYFKHNFPYLLDHEMLCTSTNHLQN